MILEKILKHFSKDGITSIDMENMYGRYFIKLEIGDDPDDEDTVDVTIDDEYFSCEVERSEYGKSGKVELGEISDDLNVSTLCMVKGFSVERDCRDGRIHVLIETVYGSKIMFIITKWNEAVRDKMYDMYIRELSNGSYLNPPTKIKVDCRAVDDNDCVTMVSDELTYTKNMARLGKYLIDMVEYFKG